MKSRYASSKYAVKGLGIFFRTQHNAWIHLSAAIVAIILGLLFDIQRMEWALIIIAIGMVLVAECLNTAIEFLVDFVSPAYHEKAGKVKDLAAAAVLISSLIAVMLGLLVFVPYFMELM